jgi:signal transduction histidine kinase
MRAVLHALWLRGLRTPAPVRYGVAAVAALLPSLLRIAMNPYWGLRLPYVFFFPATLFTALFSGLGPAWVGIGIFALVSATWILPRTDSLAVSNPIDLVGLAAFIVADGIIAWIGASHRDLIEQSEQQSAELSVRKQEAEAANRAKDDFMAVLGHELRTPLTTIVAGVRVLHQIGSPEARAAAVRDSIERQADHLTRLLDDLLDVKRIATGSVVLEPQPYELGKAVADLINLWRGSGRLKDHAMFIDVQPVWVNGDAARLQQIFENLLSNALKYTPAGGSISVSVKHEAQDAVLRVQDTGIGIRRELRSTMFDMFVQGEPPPMRVRSGLGIGLAVVRRLVDLHGGTVEVQSDGPGEGSTFTVRLPRVPAPSESR